MPGRSRPCSGSDFVLLLYTFKCAMLFCREDFMGEHILHKKETKKAPKKNLKEKREEKKTKKKGTNSSITNS